VETEVAEQVDKAALGVEVDDVVRFLG
jgi:hypothetical protein